MDLPAREQSSNHRRRHHCVTRNPQPSPQRSLKPSSPSDSHGDGDQRWNSPRPRPLTSATGSHNTATTWGIRGASQSAPARATGPSGYKRSEAGSVSCDVQSSSFFFFLLLYFAFLLRLSKKKKSFFFPSDFHQYSIFRLS